MSQHFLLSSRAKTLSLASVARMSDDEVEAVFLQDQVGQQQRQSVLPEMRLHDRLRLPASEWASALAL